MTGERVILPVTGHDDNGPKLRWRPLHLPSLPRRVRLNHDESEPGVMGGRLKPRPTNNLRDVYVRMRPRCS